MAFTKKAFKWLKRGTVPPETLQENGFTAGTKLPADYLNEQFTATYEAIEELQANAVEKITGKSLSTNDYTNAEKYKDVYVTCTTAAATTAKVATLSGFTLATGAVIKAKFSYANTATAPTLNVNSTGAKAIKNVDGTAFTDIKASTYTLVYDGTNYVVQNAIIVEDSTTSTSTTNAASAKAVKTVADAVATAQTTADSKASTDIATTTTNGLMSSADKSKLETVAQGANNYIAPTATASTLGDVKVGTNISVSSGTISVANASTTVKGVVQLNDTVTSTSTTLGATANAVKTVADAVVAAQTTADSKVDKVADKGLSTNDYTSEDMTQVTALKSVYDKLQKTKITNDDGSAVYTIGATLPTVVKGVFYATATNSGTYASPKSSVEGILIAESNSYWNFIGFSDDGTMFTCTKNSSWKGWKTYEQFTSEEKTKLASLGESSASLQANFIDLAIEVETSKNAELTGVNANIVIETFLDLDDVTLERGRYDATNKWMEV